MGAIMSCDQGSNARAGPDEVRRKHASAVGNELGNEGVHASRFCRLGSGFDWKITGKRDSSHIRISVIVYGDSLAVVGLATAEVRGINEGSSGCVQLADESVLVSGGVWLDRRKTLRSDV